MVFEVKAASTVTSAVAGNGLTASNGQLVVSSIPLSNAAGTTVYVLPGLVRVVGPVSYAAGGFSVDVSSRFSSILAVQFLRSYVTATGVSLVTRGIMPGEAGADLYSAGRFVAIAIRQSAPSFTGTLGNTSTPAASAACIATCNQNHPNLSALTYTPAGTISSSNFIESGAADLSTNTYEFLVFGVPV